MDDKLGGVAWVVGDLAQAGTVLSCDAAPALVLIGAGWARGQAVPIEVEVTAGHAGAAVTGPPAAPQALSMAALTRRRARRARTARTHCREVMLAVGKGDCAGFGWVGGWWQTAGVGSKERGWGGVEGQMER